MSCSEDIQHIVDAHFHIWDLKRFNYSWPNRDDPKLFKDVDIDEYYESMKTTAVKHSVFVHVLNNSADEAKWVIGMAKKYSFLKGVVAGLDLVDPKLEETVAELKKDPKFVGCRHILDFEDKEWLLRDDVYKGLSVLQEHNLTFDLLLRPHLLEVGKQVIAKFPRLKFVVDHIAKPYVKDGKIEGWKEGMEEIAKFPNVFCKISGLVTEADMDNWKTEDFIPYVKHIIDIFGVERCLYGSDWPVCTKANTDFTGQLELAKSLFTRIGLTKDEKYAIFHDNAVKIYGLKVN